MVQDANGHQAAALTGGLGKTNYKQIYTGTSGSYALYATTTMTYNAASDLLSTKSPDGTTVTTTYDALGRAISQKDPDSGTSTVSYDPNGNVLQTVDARGSAGTIYAGYDGLNRQLWRNSTNSATGAWVSFSYDSTANGNIGVGRLTGESFSGSGNLSGSYAYTFDARGQQTHQTTTINGTQYAVQATYNDAGQVLTQQYPTGETVTPGYSSTGWLSGLNTSAGGGTALASNLAYTGLSGAAGRIGSMSLGNGTYSYAASYDTGIRLTSAGMSTSSGGTLLYQTQPTYDAVNNVVGVQTSVGGQTDTQQFCYDDLNRLTWSGTNGTPPCSGQSIVAGTLTSAQYQQSNTYTVESGLVTGPSGSSTYGDSSHPHAVTSTSKGYSAAYDASGNMICRATTTATTCSGSSPTGQQLSYDAEGRLSLWQNQPTSPTQTVNYLYDGSGNRVAMQSTVSGTTTLTSYIGSLEEVQTSGSTTQTTTYYSVEGKRIAADVNGTFYYFGYDALGSQVAVLDNAGHLVGAQLYSPYGTSRYTNGTLPTSIGFTGQRADSMTGLDYYGARYYDPGVGQFVSADSVQGNAEGMDPYVYVGGNPETETDPSGLFVEPDKGGGIAQIAEDTGGGGGGAVVAAGIAAAVGWWRSITNQPVVVGGADENPGGFIGHGPTLNSVTWGLYRANHPHPTGGGNGGGGNTGGGGGWTRPPTQTWTSPSTAPQTQTGGGWIRPPHPGRRPAAPGGECSFTPDTKVTTSQGKQEIGKLHEGDKVLAYNPKTHQMELEPIVHVWIHKDNDLVDITLTSVTKSAHGLSAARKNEVLHTTSEHPFLTQEKGFLPAGSMHRGMHVLRADGTVGIVTGWKVVPGTKVMYNLEVAHDHTFTVGDGQWVVHNKCDSGRLRRNMKRAGDPLDTGQDAHHIIPCEFENHPLVQAAGDQFDINGAYNGRALYDSEHAYRVTQDGKPGPIHSGNHPRYSERAGNLLQDKYEDLQFEADNGTGSISAKDAASALMDTIDTLNSFMDTVGCLA